MIFYFHFTRNYSLYPTLISKVSIPGLSTVCLPKSTSHTAQEGCVFTVKLCTVCHSRTELHGLSYVCRLHYVFPTLKVFLCLWEIPLISMFTN